jgi:hypothetical protein
MSKESINIQNETARTLPGRPQVADGGDDLLIWRVADIILNNQYRTGKQSVVAHLGVLNVD